MDRLLHVELYCILYKICWIHMLFVLYSTSSKSALAQRVGTSYMEGGLPNIHWFPLFIAVPSQLMLFQWVNSTSWNLKKISSGNRKWYKVLNHSKEGRLCNEYLTFWKLLNNAFSYSPIVCRRQAFVVHKWSPLRNTSWSCPSLVRIKFQLLNWKK